MSHGEIEPPQRRYHVSVEVGPFVASVGFDPKTGKVLEVFFNNRGPSGSELDATLYELGIQLSKVIQDQDLRMPAHDPI